MEITIKHGFYTGKIGNITDINEKWIFVSIGDGYRTPTVLFDVNNEENDYINEAAKKMYPGKGPAGKGKDDREDNNPGI